MKYIWYILGYEDEEATPDPRQVELRNMLLCQLKRSDNIKLKKTVIEKSDAVKIREIIAKYKTKNIILGDEGELL